MKKCLYCNKKLTFSGEYHSNCKYRYDLIVEIQTMVRNKVKEVEKEKVKKQHARQMRYMW